MEWNQVLVFGVCIMSLALAVGIFRVQGLRPWGWYLVLTGVTALTLLASHYAPQLGGWLGAAAWLVLVALPLWLARWEMLLLLRQRFTLARRVSQVARWLHPLDGWWHVPPVLEVLEFAQARGEQAAEAKLATIHVPQTAVALAAIIQFFRLDARWEALAAWVDRHPQRTAILGDFTVAFHYLRALGELGRLPEAITAYDELIAKFSPAGQPVGRLHLRMLLLALTGQTAAIEELLRTALAGIDPPTRTLWIAAAYQAAGDIATADEKLSPLCQAKDRLVARAAERRKALPLPRADLSALDARQQATLATIVEPPPHERHHSSLHYPLPGVPCVTITLIAVQVLVFVALDHYLNWQTLWRWNFARFTWSGGGSEDIAWLTANGALLVPWVDLRFSAWRIFTAGFLHYGSLHLCVNLLALWLFGRYLERLLGHAKLLGGFLLTGWFAMTTVLVLGTYLGETASVVGSSGSVMGLVGISLAISLRSYRLRGSQLALQQVLMIFALLVVEVIFDFSHPQISVTAHLAGLAMGVLLGLVARVELR